MSVLIPAQESAAIPRNRVLYTVLQSCEWRIRTLQGLFGALHIPLHVWKEKTKTSDCCLRFL